MIEETQAGMPPAPLVSIVLPTCNGSRFVRQALDSCLGQSLQGWELIVVDDGSSDQTPSIVADYVRREPRVRCVRQANRGLPAALNAGFALAQGKLLTWISDDNLFRPDALEKMSAFLNERAEADVVFADCRVIDEVSARREAMPAGPLDDLPLRNCVGACFLYRREVHEALGGYREDFFLAEDYDFWLRASQRFALAHLPLELYDYRRHAESLSVTREKRAVEAIERALADNLPRMPWVRGDVLAQAWLRLVHVAMSDGRRADARRYLGHALVASPLRVLRDDARAAAWLLIPAPLYNTLRAAYRLVPLRGRSAAR